MYTNAQYKNFKRKYGSYSSWAIWNENNLKDTLVIEENIPALNSEYVFLGLNVSKELDKAFWSNFHGGRHDRKLMIACNDTKLRGSYITDIFKDLPITKASDVEKYLEAHPEQIKKNVDSFNNEMSDIGINEDSVFIVLGVMAQKFYENEFRGVYKNKYVNYRHYSCHGTDEAWVNGLGKELGIKKIEEWRKGKLK